MKVLQITAFSGWGCTGRIAVGIHNALISKGHESVIAWGRTNTADADVSTIQIGNSLDQKIHGLYTRLTDRCGFASKQVTKAFIRKIDEYSPDLIQLHIMHGYYVNLEILFSYIKKKNIPVVWTFHDCWAFTGHCPYFDLVRCNKWKKGCYDCEQKSHHPTSWILDNSKWNWMKKKEIYGDYSLLTVVAPSQWLGGLVKQSFLKNTRVEVINNGIDIKTFKPTYGNYFQKYNLENKKIVLGVSSTWAESKGINDFYKIADLLGIDCQVVLVGLQMSQIKHLPKNILGIARTDSIEELAEIYTAASVFVNPTYEDNYPTTNLEAIACGTPVITYQTGGSVEIVKKTGGGLIVEQGNIKALVEAINQVLIDEINCSEKIKSMDKKILNEKEKFLEYVSLYEEIMGS